MLCGLPSSAFHLYLALPPPLFFFCSLSSLLLSSFQDLSLCRLEAGRSLLASPSCSYTLTLSFSMPLILHPSPHSAYFYPKSTTPQPVCLSHPFQPCIPPLCSTIHSMGLAERAMGLCGTEGAVTPKMLTDKKKQPNNNTSLCHQQLISSL